MKIFRWVMQSLEDDKGQASYKRIGIAIFLFLIAYMVFARMITTQLWLNAFYALLTTATLWVGLVTVPQVLMFFGRDKTPAAENDDSQPQKIEGEVTLKPTN